MPYCIVCDSQHTHRAVHFNAATSSTGNIIHTVSVVVIFCKEYHEDNAKRDFTQYQLHVLLLLLIYNFYGQIK